VNLCKSLFSSTEERQLIATEPMKVILMVSAMSVSRHVTLKAHMIRGSSVWATGGEEGSGDVALFATRHTASIYCNCYLASRGKENVKVNGGSRLIEFD
jgi:hypothetical protein